MKDELKQCAARHATKLIGKISEVMQVPEVIQDAIRKEMEYSTMDGYRITMRHTSRNGDPENDSPA